MVLVFSTVVNGTFTHSYLFQNNDIIKDNYYVKFNLGKEELLSCLNIMITLG